MRRSLFRLLLISTLTTASPVFSQGYGALENGSQLLESCRIADRAFSQDRILLRTSYGVACVWFLRGVRQTLQVFASQEPGLRYSACLPGRGISDGQAARTVVSHLERNPRLDEAPAVAAAHLAFIAAYPCR